jgi:hypothetical protein
MNDLDLRAALQRDADLVGAPAPDLLDQLAHRRQLQRRQRAGVLAAAAAVVVIAAGIPVGASLVTRSDGGPATRTTVEQAPSVTPTPEVTPEPTPEVVAPPPPVAPETTAPETTVPATPAPETTAPQPTAPEPPVPSPADVVPVTCPGPATLRALLPPDTADAVLEWDDDTMQLCSGGWSLVVYTVMYPEEGQARVAGPSLFHSVDGAWTAVNRNQSCQAGEVPADIRELTCNAG